MYTKNCFLPLFALLCLSAVAKEGDVTLSWGRKGVSMRPSRVEGITFEATGGYATVIVEDTMLTPRFVLTGQSAHGGLTLKAKSKATLVLNDVELTAQGQPALHIKNSKRTDLRLRSNTHNALRSEGDTLHGAVVKAKGKLRIEGQGALAVSSEAVGCKGIKSKKIVEMRGGEVSVIIKGQNIRTKEMGGPPPGEMAFPEGEMAFEDFGAMMPPPMGMPPMGEMPEGWDPEFMPPMGGMGMGAAEGVEGKKGVSLLEGTLFVEATDDAINSNGPILFGGARVTAISRRNDAVDSNHRADGAITISAGHVLAQSGAGPPEEGLDCDQWAIRIEGGEAFTIGSGMGPEPSMPRADTATQPWRLFQNLNITEGDVLTLVQGDEVLFSVKAAVSCPMNHTLITSPRLTQEAQLLINGKPAEQ